MEGGGCGPRREEGKTVRKLICLPPLVCTRARSLSLALTCSPNVFAQILYVALRSLAVFVVTSYAIDGWAKKMMGGLLVDRIQALGGLFSGNHVPLLQSSIL